MYKIKLFFGYRGYDGVTTVIAVIGLRSFRTVIIPPPLIGGGVKRRLTSVCRMAVAYIGPT